MTPTVIGPDGLVTRGIPFTHGVILLAYHADRMARIDLAQCNCANNSKMPCQFCCLTTVWLNGTSRQLGYDDPVVCSTGKCAGLPMKMGVNKLSLHYTDVEHMARGYVQAQANAR